MKILFITPLPPPVHGSAMVSQYIKDSRLVQETFDCDFVNLSTSRRMDEIGKGGVKKLLRFVGSYFTLFWKLLTRHYDLCYLAITCHDKGFLKDAPFVLLCKLFGRRVMIHQHNKGMSGCVDRWPYRWLLPWVYRNTTVMLLSWHLYPDIERVVKREQVVVCANGVPPLQAVGHWPLAVGPSEDDNDASELQANSQAPSANSQAPFSHTDSTDSFSCQRASQRAKCRFTCDFSASAASEDINQQNLDTITQKGKSLRPCCHPEENSKLSTLNPKQTNEGVPRLLFLSNLIPSKGVYVLLDACKMLKERGLQFVCDFVGGETKEISRATFEAAVRERDLEDVVRYHGPKYGEEKLAYFAQSDVFVFPTFYHNECFPLVLLEAMQWRLPLVSSDEGGIPDIVQNGENGFVCQRQDALSLAEALEKLISNPALRRQMGERGYERYKAEYTLTAFEQNFVEMIRGCL